MHGLGYIRFFSALGMETTGKSPTDHHHFAFEMTGHV
jgi:hypothetical protein